MIPPLNYYIWAFITNLIKSAVKIAATIIPYKIISFSILNVAARTAKVGILECPNIVTLYPQTYTIVNNKVLRAA